MFGEVTEEALANLKQGVYLEDGMARFTDISDGGGKNKSLVPCSADGG